jgi:hypothetical protein
MKVFLGGTCANSTWREELIPKLNIDYFNPVVKNWTPECQQEEIRQREICEFTLYVITKEISGYYSIAEVIDDSYRKPHHTIFCFLREGLEIRQIKSLEAVGKMIERNGSIWAKDLNEVANYLNQFAGK